MKKNILLPLLIIIILPMIIISQSKCLVTIIEDIDINGSSFKGEYKIFLSNHNEKWIEVKVNKNKFIVPKEFTDKEKLNVKFVFGEYQLVFSKIHISKFSGKWLVGVDDKPPFSDEYVSSDEYEEIKRIYYINFESTLLVVVESN